MAIGGLVEEKIGAGVKRVGEGGPIIFAGDYNDGRAAVRA
jgi:hypothetical protein